MRPVRTGPRQTMKEVPRLEQRRVERLAVEADQRARARKLRADGLQQRALVRVTRQQPLTRTEGAVGLEPPAADEKRERACAAAQSGRLEIEEDERQTR